MPAICACLDELLNRFQAGPQADDTAALALRLLAFPKPAPRRPLTSRLPRAES
jgi:hypothetical protein